VNLIFIVDLIAHARLRNSISGLCHRSLVAFRAVRDLLLRAKHLFVDASTSGKLNPGLNSRRHHATKVE
jgi:hypothetical protein